MGVDMYMESRNIAPQERGILRKCLKELQGKMWKTYQEVCEEINIPSGDMPQGDRSKINGPDVADSEILASDILGLWRKLRDSIDLLLERNH